MQLTLAASRYPREADAATPEDPMKAFNDLFEQAKKSVSGAFTKENVDSAVAALTKAGEKVAQVSTDVFKSIKKVSEEA